VIGAPFLLVLTGGTVWLAVGRALRPVAQIHGAVTAITLAEESHGGRGRRNHGPFGIELSP